MRSASVMASPSPMWRLRHRRVRRALLLKRLKTVRQGVDLGAQSFDHVPLFGDLGRKLLDRPVLLGGPDFQCRQAIRRRDHSETPFCRAICVENTAVSEYSTLRP